MRLVDDKKVIKSDTEGFKEQRKRDRRMHREMPDDEHKIIAELWYVLIGTNGEGVLERLRTLEERFSKLQDDLERYLTQARKESCFYIVDKKKRTAIRVEKTRTFRETVKFVLAEGIKIGIALGVFTAIGEMLGLIGG